MAHWNVTNRKFHRIVGVLIALPLLIIGISGVLLQLRGSWEWIQPPSAKGSVQNEAPAVSHADLLTHLQGVSATSVKGWSDVSQVIFRPGAGVYQVRLKANYEVFVDASTGAVLSEGPRLTGVIEKIHEGEYFHPVVSKFLFLPTGALVGFLSFTGLILYFYPIFVKRRRAAEGAGG